MNDTLVNQVLKNEEDVIERIQEEEEEGDDSIKKIRSSNSKWCVGFYWCLEYMCTKWLDINKDFSLTIASQ